MLRIKEEVTNGDMGIIIGNQTSWTRVSSSRFERSDNAAVRYCEHGKGGWMIYKPSSQMPIGCIGRNGVLIPIKYPSYTHAMEAADSIWPT